LSECFNKELRQITGNKVEAKLISAGTKFGVSYSKIVIQPKDGQPYSGKIADILSEGEFRGVSLAGFFAELAMDENTSAIVFDDPVSSLDYINVGRIADRIASEVGKRQIIIFTHDILFVSYLMDRVDKKLISYATVESLGQAGLISDGLPFDKMSVKDRLGKLKDMLQREIKPAYTNNQTDNYRRLAGQFYKDLRMSWERSVEEILFGDVVKRYSHDVSTRQLKDVKYTPENAKIVEQNMTLCSSYLLHDPAHSEPINFGTSDDLEKNLKALEDFRKNNLK
jgi:ABC-type multidrug transport system ATPase subunit